jgi:hypothetical protein
MPVKRRKGFRRRIAPELSTTSVFLMLNGNDFFGEWRGSALEADQAWKSPEAEQYIRNLWSGWREFLLTQWISHYPGTRPWAWWMFDAPEPRNPDESEPDYLKRHGLLTKPERGGVVKYRETPDWPGTAKDVRNLIEQWTANN